MKNVSLLIALLIHTSLTCFGQYPRLNDHNVVSWFVYTGDHKLTKHWAIHTEYQWRRVNGLHQPQQNLARVGLVRTLTDRVQVSMGYTNFQSFRYGDHPDVKGRPEPEHRLYQDITLSDKLGRVGLEHRVRLEQRLLGNRDATGQGSVQDWEYQNRIRYQLSATFPLRGSTLDDGEFYVNAFDELFIGFGRNVEENVFNQNRLSAGLGYQLLDGAKIELNYLYQLRQHAEADPVANRSVVEINHGFRLNLQYDINFSR